MIDRLRPFAEHLTELIGPAAVDLTPSEMVHGVAPALRVRPASPEQLARCLAAAQTHGVAVIPRGGGSQQSIGSPPARAEVLLETQGLATRVAWEPGDLTASFEAGATLAAVQEQLATAGQQLAIDAPRPEHASLGGLVATNTSGPRRWRYGRWRDQIIGMEMALPGGELIKSGGRVVKNVQGYDLAKLFIGSLGTLGVITQLNLRVVPRPPLRWLVWVSGDLDPLLALLQFVAASTLRVSTLDLLDSECGARCALPAEAWLGLVLLEGTAPLVEHHSQLLRERAVDGGLRADVVEGGRLDSVWRSWLDLDSVDDLTAGEAVICLSCQPSEVRTALHAVLDLVSELAVPARCWARAGNGVVCARVSAPVERAAAVIAVLQRRLLERWPWTTVTAGDPNVARAVQPWGRTPPAFELMQALKQRFDPLGTLQPGRYVGGI